GCHRSPTRKSQALLVAGEIEIRAGVTPVAPAEIADGVLLMQLVVVAIASGIDRVPRDCGGEWAIRAAERCAGFPIAIGAELALDPPRRRQIYAGLGDDIDDTADRAVAIEHGAAVAARDLDAFDAIQRDRAEVDASEIDIVEPPAIDQDKRIRRARDTKATHVDRGLSSVHAAEQ